MALETDRCSPSSGSSPGPASSTRPGSDHSSLSNRSGTPDSCRSLCCSSNSPQPSSVLHKPCVSHETPHLMHHTPQPPPLLLHPSRHEHRCGCCGPTSPLTYTANVLHTTACRPCSPRSTPSSPSHNHQSIFSPLHTRTPPFSSPPSHPTSPSPSQPLKSHPSPASNTSRTSFSSSPQSSLPPSPSHLRHQQATPPDHQQQASSPQGRSPRPTNNDRGPQSTALPFSVANILRPDFGRRALITSKQHESLYTPGTVRRTVTPICDYHTLYRPHEHLPVQPLRAPKPTKGHHSAWPPLTASRQPSLPDNGATCKVTSNHQHARSKEAQLPLPSSGTTSPPLSPASSAVSAASPTSEDKAPTGDTTKGPQLWPAWVYCTRYSDRPSSGESASLSLSLSPKL